jgi:deoxycytidylate deaminase
MLSYSIVYKNKQIMETNKKNIKYPYIPEGKNILYVPIDNKYIQEAKNFAKENSLDKTMPNSSIIVKNDSVIGRGANGSDYHEKHGCYRVKNNIPTGQGYELCEGCSSKNHGEAKALANSISLGNDPNGADIYLWGHWWCCEPCWNAMIKAGIKDVYLMEGSDIFFDKTKEGNIVGHQFEE